MRPADLLDDLKAHYWLGLRPPEVGDKVGKQIYDLVVQVLNPVNSLFSSLRHEAVFLLGKRKDRDLRAITAVAIALKDPDVDVVESAAWALGQAGWLDGTLDGCLRNTIIANLLGLSAANQQSQPRLARIAAKSAETLQGLGLVDQDLWPPWEKCKPGTHPNKPNKPDGDGWSTGTKTAVAVAALAVLGLGAYLVLGGRRQTPLQGWEPPRPRRKCPRFAAAFARVETLVQDTDTADWTDLSRRLLTGNMADADFFARKGDCAAAGNKLAVVRQILRRGRSAAPWELLAARRRAW